MSVGGRGAGKHSLISSLLKDVRYPGQGLELAEDVWRALTFNTLTTDQLFPLTGLDNNPTFYIREDGYYNLYFEVRHPGTSVGFGNGFTGTGHGGAHIKTSRYGDEAQVLWGPQDQSAPDAWMLCGPIKRYLYNGDWVQFWTYGGATGHGVVDWDAKATITRLRS